MINTMNIDGYKAVIQYDPEIHMFRGEFIGLNGGADFYGKDVDALKEEGKISLNVFLEMCKEDNIAPLKEYSGKFMLRVDPSTHENIEAAAKAHGLSMNQWASEALRNAAERY